MQGLLPTISRNQWRQLCLGCLLSFVGTSVLASDCAFWGVFAETIHSDYATRVEVGIPAPDALEQTADLVNYGYSNPGSMEYVYLSAVLAALEAGLSRDAVNRVGQDVCLSYPNGTFDPDSGQ